MDQGKIDICGIAFTRKDYFSGEDKLYWQSVNNDFLLYEWLGERLLIDLWKRSGSKEIITRDLSGEIIHEHKFDLHKLIKSEIASVEELTEILKQHI